MQTIEQELNTLKEYNFDFENIVFEGCGVRIMGYVGAIKVLETLGIMKNCKRFSGASSGSIIAAMCAIGRNSTQIEEFMWTIKFDSILKDTNFGWLSIIPNIFRRLGWNSGDTLKNMMRTHLKNTTGNADITFRQIYEQFGNELCIIGMNVSSMSITYFHPKTTPHFSVATAVVASCAMPLLLEPVRVKEAGFVKSTCFVDGGMLCKFPLHVFDGWYLSMKPEDNFFRKLIHDEWFDTYNSKTLGLVQYNAWEGEYKQGELHSRNVLIPVERPKTKLASKRAAKCNAILRKNILNHDILMAVKRFLILLGKINIGQNNTVSLQDFRRVFEALDFNTDDKVLLFGHNCDFKHAFLLLDTSGTKEITSDQFLTYLKGKGIDFCGLLQGGHMRDIENFGDFYSSISSAIVNVRRSYQKKDDTYRMVGIYTDYIDGLDLAISEADKRFLLHQGVTSTIMYFKYLIRCRNHGHLPDSMSATVSKELSK